MTWIRGPWWDACWILSGLPIGLAASLLALWVPPLWILAAGVIIFQTAHTISPIGLAWSHAGFRRIMLAHPIKFVIVPGAILGTWSAVGYIGGLYWPQPSFNPVTLRIDMASQWQPLWVMGAIYGVWNIYHFGKQNFGVMSIYRHKAGGYDLTQRRLDLIFCCLTAWTAMAVPLVHMTANYLRIEALRFHNVLAAYIAAAAVCAAIMLWREWRAGRFCLGRIALILTNAVGMGTVMFWWLGGVGIISMNHWLAAVGLAGLARERAVIFPIAVIAIGTALFCALFMRGWAIPTRVAATAVAFRLALGIVHFLYDRWVWKLSDPEVRATIGHNLLDQREARPDEKMAARAP